MALINVNPAPVQPPKQPVNPHDRNSQAPVTVMDPPHHSAVVDTRWEPIGSLMQYVEGKAWNVDYFQQVLGRDDELSPQQTNVGAPFQQYARIRNMELKVTQALSPTQDERSKEMEVQGEATTYPLFIPNAGDMFLADIGDGRQGVFAVINSTKRTHLKESYYQIRYELKGYSDTLGSTMQDLEYKTIQEFHFVKDYLHFGQNPKLLTKDYNFHVDGLKIRDELIDYYMHEMFSNDHHTLLVPNQEYTTYDPFVSRFMSRILTARDHRNIGELRQPSVDGQLVMRHPTVWDAMLEMNVRLLRNLTHRVRLIETDVFKSQPLYSGIFYTGIFRIVFPFHTRTDVDADYDRLPPLLASALLRAGKRRFSELDRMLGIWELQGLSLDQLRTQVETQELGVDALPDCVPVTVDDYYVFSGPFYRQQKPMSKLEYLVLQFLREQDLDKPVLLELAKASVEWGNLERYYYTPCILALLTAAMRRN